MNQIESYQEIQVSHPSEVESKMGGALKLIGLIVSNFDTKLDKLPQMKSHLPGTKLLYNLWDSSSIQLLVWGRLRQKCSKQ